MKDTGDIVFTGCGAAWSRARDIARENGCPGYGQVCAYVLRDFYRQQKRAVFR